LFPGWSGSLATIEECNWRIASSQRTEGAFGQTWQRSSAQWASRRRQPQRFVHLDGGGPASPVVGPCEPSRSHACAMPELGSSLIAVSRLWRARLVRFSTHGGKSKLRLIDEHPAQVPLPRTQKTRVEVERLLEMVWPPLRSPPCRSDLQHAVRALVRDRMPPDFPRSVVAIEGCQRRR